jgi:putative aldouronate transport system substrate-binding protein
MLNGKLLKVISVFIALFIFIFPLTACVVKDTGKGDSVKKSSQVDDKAKSTEDIGSKSDEKPDPFGKYTPPIEVTAVRYSTGYYKFNPKDPDYASLEKNLWIRQYEERLGIKLKYLWICPDDQYEQKWNVALASNDIPDMAGVGETVFKMLVDADMVEDMTNIYEKYASPVYKGYDEFDENLTREFSTFNGKLMGLPIHGSQPDNSDILMVKSDWLKKLSLPEPKTIDDICMIAEAFAKDDPDGNSKADTIGLVFGNAIDVGFLGLKGFINGFNAYWHTWNEDGSGNLVYGSIQPEIKNALLKLQDMYKRGLLDQEFAVKDPWKAGEAIASGKAGMAYGTYWAPYVSFMDNVKADSEAEWKVLPIPTVDGQPSKPQAAFSPAEYFYVKKGFEHPEAAVKIINLNIQIENEMKMAALEAEAVDDDPNAEVDIYQYKLAQHVHKPWGNLDSYHAVKDALISGDDSKLINADDIYTYNSILAAKDGSRDDIVTDLVFGLEGTFSVINQYRDEHRIQVNKFRSFCIGYKQDRWYSGKSKYC